MLKNFQLWIKLFNLLKRRELKTSNIRVRFIDVFGANGIQTHGTFQFTWLIIE